MPSIVVKGDANAGHTLSERMAALHVPGVSIAVIHHGVIEWAQGFGRDECGRCAGDGGDFVSGGSISKPVAAMAALRLVQEGKLSLDADVNTDLTSWKLAGCTELRAEKVTLRELLTHTGGTTVHGFPGYAAGEPVPTLVQVLDGEKPANTPAIRMETAPGTKWNYSGGGFTIMQMMLIDVTKEPFPKLLHDTVLKPIGMTHSTYEQPLPAEMRATAATPYEGKGKPWREERILIRRWLRRDCGRLRRICARYLMEVQRSLKGECESCAVAGDDEGDVDAGDGEVGIGAADRWVPMQILTLGMAA